MNVRTVTGTEEMTEFRIFRRTGKMYSSECWPSQKGKIKKNYTPNHGKKNTKKDLWTNYENCFVCFGATAPSGARPPLS